MIVRNYCCLKLRRTYIGGSKTEELKIFMNVQGIKNNKICNDPQIDWFEFRRLSIKNFEDVICVTFSRKIFTKITSYMLLLLSFNIMLLNYDILFFICFGLSYIFQAFFQYFKWKEKKEISNYNLVITLTNNMIRKESGLNLMCIK